MSCVFRPGEFMLPQPVDVTWPVIACDQFTSDPEYWQRLRQAIADRPSTLNMILPEVCLDEPEDALDARTRAARSAMDRAISDGTLQPLGTGYVYVERTLQNGSVRRGLVGIIDLEQYDVTPGSQAAVRPTERTVAERIPPRMRLRQQATLDFSHVLLFADDPQDRILGTLEACRDSLPCLYDLDLLEQGGHIRGYAVTGTAADTVSGYIQAYEQARRALNPASPLLYAVGDGNHSLAAARACYTRACQTEPESAVAGRRYATVELINLRDASLQFEPIHRIVYDTDVQALLHTLEESVCCPDGIPVTWRTRDQEGILRLNPALGLLPIHTLQTALDQGLDAHPGRIDYIHDEDALLSLVGQSDSIGFLLPAIDKNRFFDAIAADGVFPRKTFSIGHAREKRYYMETRILMA